MPSSIVADTKLFYKVMRKSLTKFDVYWIVASVVVLATLWGRDIPIDNDLIPTIVNGATTTTALLTSFVGILMTIGYSNPKLNLSEMRNRISWTLIFLTLALSLVAAAYLSYVDLTSLIDFKTAFRSSLSGLIISIASFSTFSKAFLDRF